jgi:methyl-accepting chemotaxis protein
MLERVSRAVRHEDGQGIIAVIVSIVAFVIAAFLLYQTFAVSVSIRKKADTIEDNAVSINTSASSIARLVQTEATLASILETSKPLVPSLDKIIEVGSTIERQAVSINGSIQAIGGSVRGIGSEISTILGTTRTISGDINSINNLLDRTIDTGRAINDESDTIETSLASAEMSVCRLGLPIVPLIPTRTCVPR